MDRLVLHSQKFNSEYLFQDKIIINKKILKKVSNIDTLIFDVDGVLVDVRESYKNTVCLTVQFYFEEILQFKGSQKLILPEEVDYFKMAGGFNNDWELTSAVILFYLMKTAEYNLKNIDKLRNKKPNLKEYCTKILPSGGGLVKAVELAKNNKHIKETIFRYWDNNLITKIFQEIYAGKEYCFDIYGFNPSSIKSEGLIKKEKIIINKKKIGFLKNFSIGILTCRNISETKIFLERLNWNDMISEKNLVTADDGLGKPHPQGLKKLSINLKTQLGLYTGDILDDLVTVKNFNQEYERTKFLSAIVLAKRFHLKDELVNFYLNEGVDLLAQDINCILDWLASNKNKKF